MFLVYDIMSGIKLDFAKSRKNWLLFIDSTKYCDLK